MGLTRNTRLSLAAAAAIVVIAAVAVWAIWFRGGVKAGAGPFTAELAECRSLLEQDLQHVPMEYLEASVWRQGNAAELRIGGLFRLTSGIRPTVHNYECLARGGRVLRQEAF